MSNPSSDNDGPAWIMSEGGPLLVAAERDLPDWSGIDKPKGRKVAARSRYSGDPDAPATDFDRASDVDGLLGVIDVGQGRALVLGGEPSPVTWWPAGDAGYLVRWRSGGLELDIADAMRRFAPDAMEWRDAAETWTVASPNASYLFDCAFTGEDVLEDQCDAAAVMLAPGEYALASADYRPDADTLLIVHRLRAAAQAAV